MRAFVTAALLASLALVQATDYSCPAKKSNKVININDGDSFSYNTNDGDSYSSKMKCQVTYKMKSSCKKMKFSCSSLDLPNKDKKKCRKGDRLMVGKKVFCLKKKPSVTVQGKAAKKGLKVMFMTDKKKFGGGAQCTAECIQGVTTTTPSTTAGTTTTTPASTATTTNTTAPTTTTAGAECSCGVVNRSGSRIVGGQQTEANEYPWHAGIEWPGENRPRCGGTLISDRHVLTSASCAKDENPSSLTVVLGAHRASQSVFGINDGYSYSTDPSVTLVDVASITAHPGYTYSFANPMYQDDFAILTLAEAVTFSATISPACLPSDAAQSYAGQTATATGWGKLDYNDFTEAAYLQEVDLPVISNQECQAAYDAANQGSVTVGETNLCCDGGTATGIGGKDACIGDDGGPLVVAEHGRHTLVGVVSWGVQCAIFPGVYSRVTARKDWILANTQGTQDNCGGS